MTSPAPQRVRCPCCGEIFTLTDAMLVSEAAASMQPATEGDAPEAALPAGEAVLPIVLVFDGGSIGNPGRGYGSYQLTVRGKREKPRRLELGDEYTNNEAEYDTLIEALTTIRRRAKDPRRVRLDIRGDSQLVVNQINGVWKAREPRMRERLEQVRRLLADFGAWTATWHDRGQSVKALGH